MTQLRKFQFGLSFLWWCIVAAQETAQMVVFDLVPAAATNSSMPGVMAMSFGSPPQDIDVLVAFYTDSEAAVHVPTGALCGVEQVWNPIQEPSDGDFVFTSNGSNLLAGFELVQWKPSSDAKTLNITLRKGRGENAGNVTIIEKNIVNDGEYQWDAGSTFIQHNLTSASDYSLMLWTENPPRRSISGYFSLGPTSVNATLRNEATNHSEGFGDCLAYLRSNGGYYNQTEDNDFSVEVLVQVNVSNPDTAYEVENLDVGSTSLSWSDGTNSTFRLTGMPIDLIWESTLGMGMVGLNVLQRARNSRIPEMDVVALNLGTGENTGSVVMGGYDDALIDHKQKTIFSKTEMGEFEVVLTGITYIGSTEKTIISNSASSDKSKIILTYDSPNIQLSPETLEALLPMIGSPTFDEDLNGYVYPGTPQADYSLRFTLENDTMSTSIIVPASSLLVTDTLDNNPLTPRTESGQTYLRLSPSSGDHPAYLGRVFLQHVYLINAPPTINRFHISAIPSPAPKAKSLIAASPASISIFGPTSSSYDDGSAIGPIVGGILGGLVVVVGGIAAWIWVQRKRRRIALRSGSKLTVHFAEDKNSPIPSCDPEKELGSSGNRGGGGGGGGSKTVTMSTNMSSFSRDISSFVLPPQNSPEPPAKDPELIRHLSQQSAVKKRQSENSTAARVFMGPYSPQIDDIQELKQDMHLQRTATVGRFYSAGRVAKVESPTLQRLERAKTTRSHVRTASIGRICTPTSVEFLPITSRRGSMKTVGSSDCHMKNGSADSSDKEGMAIKEEKENSKGKSKMRWSNSTKTTDVEESDTSSVFGLAAVTKDGSEFLKDTTRGNHENNSDDDSSRPSTIESRNGEDSILKVEPLVIRK